MGCSSSVQNVESIHVGRRKVSLVDSVASDDDDQDEFTSDEDTLDELYGRRGSLISLKTKSARDKKVSVWTVQDGRIPVRALSKRHDQLKRMYERSSFQAESTTSLLQMQSVLGKIEEAKKRPSSIAELDSTSTDADLVSITTQTSPYLKNHLFVMPSSKTTTPVLRRIVTNEIRMHPVIRDEDDVKSLQWMSK